MKLLSVALARSIWFVDLNDLNPRGLSIYPMLVPALREEYKFQKYPQTAEEWNEQSGVKFLEGEYVNPQGDAVMVSFTIYNNGLLADTRSSTEDSDSFLKDVLNMAEGFGLTYHPEMIKKKVYVSQLYLSTERSLNSLNPKLEKFAHRLSSLLDGVSSIKFETVGITLSPDLELRPGPLPFRFERQDGRPFSENRYFSQAPLHTDLHIQLLGEFEDILS